MVIGPDRMSSKPLEIQSGFWLGLVGCTPVFCCDGSLVGVKEIGFGYRASCFFVTGQSCWIGGLVDTVPGVLLHLVELDL